MEENIKLTIVEREILANQFRILEKLEGDNQQRDYRNLIEALERGYELHYMDVFEDLSETTLSKDDCRRVLDILEMFRGLIYSYQGLKRDRVETTLTENDVKFVGFDGNDPLECKYMLYTSYFIQDLDRYSEIQEISHPSFNSHCKMISTYMSMLQRWHEFKQDKTINQYLMNEEQIRYVMGDYKASIF